MFRRLKENRNFRVQWHRFMYYWYFIKVHYYGKEKHHAKADAQKQLWQAWEQVPAPVKPQTGRRAQEQAEETRYQPLYLRVKNRLLNAGKKADAQ
ncbi:hypothetical protein CR205_10790 [Alteribacter lacisalsi]|uniref:Uncharacterized protein n=1 Tax=Alteribacter lacisalsi TaxID=2045244 RepID=A0A2W0HGJ0_9BACI|nr:hypothetical protein [Alteribacter lacisalsi]PYZ99020.1 hypothetical protein CR205_10790 [Alteribacter lacisalsi]